MFLLKYLEVKEDEKEVLNIDFIGDREVDERPIFSTLILGENGTGKSFLLKTIVDIFIYISKAQIYKRKPKFKYSKFCVKYSIDGNEYCVKKESGRDIFCWKNGTEIVLDEVELPKKVLAVSFMVNDKFRFVKPGEDIGSIYKYLGVRKSTNSTYTSSVMQNVFYSVVHMMKNHTITELEKVLSVLHFDSKVEISFKSEKCNSESKMKKSSCIRKCSIDCSNPDYGKNEEVLEELEQAISSLDDKEKNKCNIAFYKKGRCIQFEDCSSGEKHMIFAFTGVLSSIGPKSVILIDEPEISLHPEWQIQYVSLLKKIFKKYDGCHFILASHSHYLVSDLESSTSSIISFRKSEMDENPIVEVLPYETYAWSAENIIYNVFGLRTARNYYFESDLRELLTIVQDIEENTDKIEDAKKLVEKLRKFVYNTEDPLHVVIEQSAEILEKCTHED